MVVTDAALQIAVVHNFAQIYENDGHYPIMYYNLMGHANLCLKDTY